jgi:hypothetical protein
MLAIAMPTAWPVVPPGKGRLNIMTVNEKAENTASAGIVREDKTFLTVRSAPYQNGADATYKVAQVDGLR